MKSKNNQRQHNGCTDAHTFLSLEMVSKNKSKTKTTKNKQAAKSHETSQFKAEKSKLAVFLSIAKIISLLSLRPLNYNDKNTYDLPFFKVY